jgi:peptide/nickel transport system permease protein
MTIDAVAVSGLSSSRRRHRPSLVVLLASIVILAVIVCAILGTEIAPYDPNAQDLLGGLAGPSSNHLLGTDDLGRDILSRTIVGSRTALVGPLIIAGGAMLIGNVLGLISGYLGGLNDSLIMRAADLVYALPALLVAIVVVGVLGGGYFLAVGMLLFLFIPFDTRLIRGATLEQKNKAYVEAAETLGLSRKRIMFLHIWPNVLPVAVGNACLAFAFSLVSLSALSYLGLGVGPGTADWGLMLSDSRTLLFQNPMSGIAPGVALVLTAASVSIVGDWLYERLSDRGQLR